MRFYCRHPVQRSLPLIFEDPSFFPDDSIEKNSCRDFCTGYPYTFYKVKNKKARMLQRKKLEKCKSPCRLRAHVHLALFAHCFLVVLPCRHNSVPSVSREFPMGL